MGKHEEPTKTETLKLHLYRQFGKKEISRDRLRETGPASEALHFRKGGVTYNEAAFQFIEIG
jgi:hypothetical protein